MARLLKLLNRSSQITRMCFISPKSGQAIMKKNHNNINLSKSYLQQYEYRLGHGKNASVILSQDLCEKSQFTRRSTCMCQGSWILNIVS